MMINERLKTLMRPIASGLLVGISAEMLRLLRCGLFSTAPYACFTAVSIIKPLAGAYGGPLAIIISQSIRVLIQLVFYRNVYSYSVYQIYSICQIPLFCASFYWMAVGSASCDRVAPFWKRALLCVYPLFGMALFIMHPVGHQAAAYALLWLIPLATLLLPHRNRFFHALGSTFFAHIAGSLDWLATHQLTAQQWLALIPVAIIERCFMAAIMVVCMEIVECVWKKYSMAVSQAHKIPNMVITD